MGLEFLGVGKLVPLCQTRSIEHRAVLEIEIEDLPFRLRSKLPEDHRQTERSPDQLPDLGKEGKGGQGRYLSHKEFSSGQWQYAFLTYDLFEDQVQSLA